MHFTVTADTDVGISKNTNQDSVLVKQALFDGGEVLMAVICDGMGGLSKGELASATVVRGFSEWFDRGLKFELEHIDMQVISEQWKLMLKDLNGKLLEYGIAHGISLGTTFSGILFVKERYAIVHVGDSRVYHIGDSMRQLTTDQTFIAREISRGAMTAGQAKTDKRRNLLLQCVGASENLRPEIHTGIVKKGVYMLCSDGFCHEITATEIYKALNPVNLTNKNAMHNSAKYLINQVKLRQEKDNISVILIKAE